MRVILESFIDKTHAMLVFYRRTRSSRNRPIISQVIYPKYKAIPQKVQFE